MGRGEGRGNCKCKDPEAGGEVCVFMDRKKAFVIAAEWPYGRKDGAMQGHAGPLGCIKRVWILFQL